MEKLGVNKLREMFLAFFESKGHLRLESAPLVPQNDPSLLLINAGMAPLKPYFTGEITPPAKRAVSCQKCIRTPDIENVGKDGRHGTFFEMLGNFSFGDYFKRDAQAWAWEFVTKELKIPPEKVYVSVYLEDDESYDIWANEVGVDKSRIVRLGKEDNFWEIGVGPCGPCSEIYIDRGEKYGCGSPTCAPGCDCDRFVEIWNLVFTQFNSDGQGNYEPLPRKNIDTGMGLERLACIMQETDSIFDIDTMQRIIGHIVKITGVEYGKNQQSDLSIRIIADHVRSTAMMICDGVMPSNVGRGYVLRRLLRRAARHGRLLGTTDPFIFKVCDTVIEENAEVYPALKEKADFIKTVMKTEEERFGQTIEAGLLKLDSLIENMKAKGEKCLPGTDAFKLYDTDGFPIDLTVEILEEQGLVADIKGFEELMNQQKKRGKDSRGNTATLGWESDDVSLKDIPETAFKGYEMSSCKGKLLAIVSDGFVSSAAEGERVKLIFDVTPFYAESGGQSADWGRVTSATGVAKIVDVKKSPDNKYIHYALVESGEITEGQECTLEIDLPRRKAISRAHSATHIIHKALRDILGTHVEQSGSLVEEDKLRFDFSHFSPLTSDILYTLEVAVNTAVLEGLNISATQMNVNDAKAMGAMALFGEKYGDTVRVVKMGDFSIELCGGTHLGNTAEAGLVKIISEGSVAAGVRRIEAVTGLESLKHMQKSEENLLALAQAAKSTPQNLLQRIGQMTDEIKALGSAKESLEGKMAASKADSLLKDAKSVKGVDIIGALVEADSTDALRTMNDSIRDKNPDIVSVLAAKSADGKVFLAAVCGKNAMEKGAHAGNIIKQVAAICGGGGGGKPDSATAGGKDQTKVNEAVAAVLDIAAAMIK